VEVSDRRMMIKMIQEQLPTHVGDKMMTIAQQLKAEGRAEGKAEGSIETKKDIAQRLLKNETPIDIVAKITDLDIKVVQVIADKLKESQH
jgi:recombination-promoting nuclease RpnB